MQKRLLAKMPVAELDPQHKGLFEQTAPYVRFIAHGRTVEHEGEKILLLHFFPCRQTGEDDAKAAFRTFIGKTDYITQELTCQGVKWKTGALENIIPWEWQSAKGFVSAVILADGESVEACRRVVGNALPPLEALRDHQRKIITARLEAKHQVIKDRIDAVMNQFPDLPDDFEEWLTLEAFGHHRFLLYRNDPKKKEQAILCNTCLREFEHTKPRHNQAHTCPHCGRRAVFKSVRKAQRTLRNWIQTAVLLPWPGGFCVRYFNVCRDDCKLLETRKVSYSSSEEYREVYVEDKCEMYNYGKFLSSSTNRWCDNTQQICFTKAVVYCRNLPQVTAGTPFCYSGLKEYAGRENGAETRLSSYLYRYPKMPYLEYLSKLRLYRIVYELIENQDNKKVLNERGKNAAELLLVPKQHIRLLQEINPSLSDLEILQKVLAAKVQLTASMFWRVRTVYQYDADGILLATKYASMQRIENYLEKRRGDDKEYSHTVRLWADYVGFCEKLGYDLQNDFVLFPRHLKKAHDVAMRRSEALDKAGRVKRLGEMSKGMTAIFEQMKVQYGFTQGVFVMRVPASLTDIVAEGHKLRHCVGQYAEKVADGKTTILFLRQADKPKEPYFTVEIRGGKVVQCRGNKNCAAPPEVKTFLAAWEEKCLRRAAA